MKGSVYALLVATSLSFGCAYRTQSHIKPKYVATSPYGAWVNVTRRGQPRVDGELLAVDDDTVFVLHGSTVVCLPLGEVRQISVSKYDKRWAGGWLFFVAPVAMPFLHGALVIFTAPVWVVTGIFVLAANTHSETYVGPSVPGRAASWVKVAEWARYPGGAASLLRDQCAADKE